MAENKLKELVGKTLTAFKVQEVIKIVRVNEDGLNPQTLGYFKNPTVAAVFAGSQVNGNQIRTRPILVLTDGTTAYEFNEDESPVKFFNDEEEAKKIKEKILEKLTPEERKLFGLG